MQDKHSLKRLTNQNLTDAAVKQAFNFISLLLFMLLNVTMSGLDIVSCHLRGNKNRILEDAN